MAQNYFGIVTRVGHGLIAAALAGGTSVRLTHVALGDGGGAPVAPSEDMTALVNEVHRAPINTLTQDAVEPSLMWAEVVLPSNVGGWYVREAGILDEAGNLVAVASTPESYKPELAEGSGSEFVLKLPLVLTNTDTVTLKIDPTVVLASRGHVAAEVAAHDADGAAHADMRAAIEAASHGGDEHAARTDNPHDVTAAQAGATPASHEFRTDNPHGVTRQQLGAAAEAHTHDAGDISGLTVPVLTRVYASPEVALVAAGLSTLNHGLGVIPAIVQFEFVCVVADSRFNAGDVLHVDAAPGDITGSYGLCLRKTTTQLIVQFNCNAGFVVIRTPDGYGHSLGLSNWRLRIRAFA